MPPSCQNQDRITDIFFPYVANKIREVPPSSRRFAYYTTADTAMKILRSKQIWLRNTAVMNDYSEIEYGSCCFEGAYKTDPGSKFKTALESCFPGLRKKLGKNSLMTGDPSSATIPMSHVCPSTYRAKINMDASQCGEPTVAVPVSH